MPYTFKSRVMNGVQWSTTSRSFSNPPLQYSGAILSEVQRIMTESHPGYKTSDGSKDTGGVFESWKIKIPVAGYRWHSKWNYFPGPPPAPIGWQYDTDTFLCATPVVSQLASGAKSAASSDLNIAAFLSSNGVPNGPSSSTMYARGTQAIDRVKPTNPTVDLATSLAELWAERKFFSVPGRSGSLPGEYLNYQFGIAPTIGDFQDLRSAIENRDTIIRQYQRDSGKIIRRRYDFEPEIQKTRTESSAPVHALGSGLAFAQNPSGTLVKVTTTKQDYWFAGAFKYSIPKDAFPEKLAELDRLYGVVPGLSTGWELVPFSWLVDYFTPIGGLLSNMDAFMKDGLVLPYGYIMSTTHVEDKYTWRGRVSDSSGSLQTITVETVVEKTHLKRLPATPFGFGLLLSDLSPKQLSILAALGLTLRK